MLNMRLIQFLSIKFDVTHYESFAAWLLGHDETDLSHLT